jgi:WD40 repeat protein
MNPAPSSFYITGGTMGDDAPSYIEREADRELLDALLAGEFCYLLTPRQMGKSSLIIRTRRRLLERHVHAVVLDLSTIGQNLTLEQWYYGLLFELGRQLDLEDELDEFFGHRKDLGLCQRFFAAILEVALPRCQPAGNADSSPEPAVRLVIFVDELDVVRSLSFNTDEFFAAIRACYNQRARDPATRQLSFALLGVATPTDLIQDVRTSPFNIGRRIQLRDFTRAEADRLTQALGPPHLARERLHRIFYWTSGHPYLTQRLCRAVAEHPVTPHLPQTASHHQIDQICIALFLSRQAREEEDNLIFVRDSILRSDVDRTSLLELFRTIKRRPKSVPDDHANPLVNVLHLSGLVGSTDGWLRERNRVYARAFDLAWINAALPGAEVRRQRAAYQRGVVRATSIAALILGIILILAWQLRSTEIARLRQVLQNQSSTVRLSVANGLNHLASGDWFTACLWFAEAFVLDETFEVGANPDADQTTHRFRIQSILDQAPRLEQMWFDLNGQGSPGMFHPDGQRVLLGRTNGFALFDLTTGQPTTPFFGTGQQLATLSPLGRHGATAHLNVPGRITVWDINSATPALLLHDASGTNAFIAACQDLQFSPNGRYLVAALEGWQFNIWDADSGRLLKTLDARTFPDLIPSPNGSPLAARFDPTSTRLVTVGTDRHAIVWTWESSDPPLVLDAHSSWVYSAAFAPWNPDLLLTCSFDRTASLWNLNTQQRLLTVEHPGDAIRDVAFNPDQHSFVTAGWDFSIRTWNVTNGHPIAPILREHGRVMGICINPEGTRLLTLNWDGVGRVWRLPRQAPIPIPTPLTFSHDGRRALEFEPHQLRFLDPLSKQEFGSFKLPPHESVQWATFTSQPNFALASILVQHPTDPPSHQLRLFDVRRALPTTPPMRCSTPISQLTWASNSSRFAAIGTEVIDETNRTSALVCDLADNGEPISLSWPGETIRRIALSPNGKLLATISHPIADPASPHLLRVQHLADNRLIHDPWRSKLQVPHLTFSPDGRWIAASEADGSLDPGQAVLWEVLDEERRLEERVHLPHVDGVLFACFSANSQLLATCSEDQTATLWRLDNHRWLRASRPLRCQGQVLACAFNSDHTWLATVYTANSTTRGPHHRIQLWDVAHGEPIGLPYNLPGRPQALERIQFVSDNSQLLIQGSSLDYRWLVDLHDRHITASQLLAQTQLLAGQQSFLSEQSAEDPRPPQTAFGIEDVLQHATSFGPLRLLTRVECQQLWSNLHNPSLALQP